MTRVLVCGGRNFSDRELLRKTLDDLKPSLIIEGGARGADWMAMTWAIDCAVPRMRFDAEWGDISHPDARIKTDKSGYRYDANAGPRRNQRMIDEGKPDLVLAFAGGSGTADCVRRAKRAGIEVMEIN
jgi:hypothetical protein